MGQFARLLPDFGWDVSVLTAKHAAKASIDTAARDAVAARGTIVETWAPSSVINARGTANPRTGLGAQARSAIRSLTRLAMFPDREVPWVPGAIAAGRKLLAEVPHDVVLATYGPASNLVVGWTLARQFQLPLVLDFRDLWSTLPVAAFPTSWHRAAARRIERAMVKHASRVIGVASGMVTDLCDAHGVPAERGVTITNGFDPSDAGRITDARTGSNRPFRMMYVGSVNANYNLEPFWRTLRRLADAGRITPATFRLEFIGNLALGDVAAHGLSDFVESGPFVPHHEVFAALARADALLMVETAGYYARNGYAAKVFDYVLTGKPVMALVEAGGNTARLLGEAGTGYVANPANEREIEDTLVRILETKGAPPRRADPDQPPLRAFNRRRLAEELASVLGNVVETEPHGRW